MLKCTFHSNWKLSGWFVVPFLFLAFKSDEHAVRSDTTCLYEEKKISYEKQRRMYSSSIRYRVNNSNWNILGVDVTPDKCVYFLTSFNLVEARILCLFKYILKNYFYNLFNFSDAFNFIRIVYLAPKIRSPSALVGSYSVDASSNLGQDIIILPDFSWVFRNWK
jgi:uncharacterized protein YnzC (UPF0291/DUF896 family)